MKKLKIKKGDTVKVISGKDKNKIATVVSVLIDQQKVVLHGVNVVKKHSKPTQNNQGGIVMKELPIHISNVSHIDPKTSEITKVGYKFVDAGKKVRFFKKSGEIITENAKQKVDKC